MEWMDSERLDPLRKAAAAFQLQAHQLQNSLRRTALPAGGIPIGAVLDKPSKQKGELTVALHRQLRKPVHRELPDQGFQAPSPVAGYQCGSGCQKWCGVLPFLSEIPDGRPGVEVCGQAGKVAISEGNRLQHEWTLWRTCTLALIPCAESQVAPPMQQGL